MRRNLADSNRNESVKMEGKNSGLIFKFELGNVKPENEGINEGGRT